MTVSTTEVERECAALRARMASRKVSRIFDEALRPLGLKVTQFTLLAAIERGAPSSITELAEALAMERTTLTRNLRVLERRGFIEIGPEGRRRSRPLRVTEKGKALLQAALPVWRNAQDRVVARLGRDRWRTVQAALEALASVK